MADHFDSGVIVERQVQYQPIASPLLEIAPPAVPEQQPTQPEIPVLRRRVGWAIPTLFFTPPPDAIQAGWAPTFPDRLDPPVRIPMPSLSFTPQHEASEGSTTGWRGYAPEWIARREHRWTFQTRTFVQSHESFQTWRPAYPDFARRRDLPIALRQSLAFTPAHEATEGSALDWTPRYPDWFQILARPLGGAVFPLFVATGTEFPRVWAPDLLRRPATPVPTEFAWSTFTPSVAPATPEQPWIQPEWPVQPTRSTWAIPFSVWVPQHSPAEGSALDWAPDYPDRFIVRRSPLGVATVPLVVATGLEFPRVWAPDILIRAQRPTISEFAWSTFTPSATPSQPWIEPAVPARPIARPPLAESPWSFAPSAIPHPWIEPALLARRSASVMPPELAWSRFTPPVPDQFWVNPPDPTRRIARPTTTEFAWHTQTPVAPVPDLPLTSPAFPVWSKQWHPSIQIESRGPIAPLPTPTIQRVVGIVGAVWEQSSGSYIATLRDPQGNILPGSLLQTLRLTLYTVNRDNTFSIVNSRQKQPCLNLNDVTVYDALQSTADGRRFNLRWRFQPGDTTMVDAALAFERHIMLWEYTWPDGAGKHEATLVVHNLRVVS